jgi:hypothetical protein
MIKDDLFRAAYTVLAICIILFVGGCDSTEITDGTISVSFAPSNISNKISDSTLQLDTIKVLMKDIKLKDQSGNEEKKIRTGPIVVYISLSNMTTDFAVNNIPAGSYDRIRFSVHKLENSETPPDSEFKESADSSKRYSVIVKGLYNSVPFVYKSKKSAHQDIALEEPVAVDNINSANLTITVDPLEWFYKDDILLDPNDVANENDIDNNIEHAFKKCFRDDDHDGKG